MEGDSAAVRELLGREPRGDYQVVRRNSEGMPIVIRNAPLLRDGTPMPTLFWLVGSTERYLVDRLEAAGGVRAANDRFSAEALVAVHQRYADERNSSIPEDWAGPRPFGGVGGTRVGVKCLHAHLAALLGGLDDPVGRWVEQQIRP